MTSARDVTVVIACHSEQRWGSIVAAVRSVEAQTRPPAAIVVAVDHNDVLARRLHDQLPEVKVVRNDSQQLGASATRNAGAAAVTTSITAFLDDDETATRSWLASLVEPFEHADVVGTGGRYRPRWLSGRPTWFPDEFGWVVGSAFTGMPTTTARVRNVWSGNMAVRTEEFRAVGGFRVGFGKLAGRSRPEDTDLCIRMAAHGGRWVYVPDAVIDHDVPAERSTFGFFVRRSFAEGWGKVELRRQLDTSEALRDESSYLTRTLPIGFARHLRDGRRGIVRAGAIGAGLVSAGVGAMLAAGYALLPGRNEAGDLTRGLTNPAAVTAVSQEPAA
jgi:GT2 family glycosyltransferase